MVVAVACSRSMALGCGSAGRSARAQAQTPRVAAAQRAQRYQIAMMEGVLERAVEHGATITRDRLQALLPAEMLLTENARARGFRLEGYGVFFDVVVPGLEGRAALELPHARSERSRSRQRAQRHSLAHRGASRTTTSSRRSSGSSCRWRRSCRSPVSGLVARRQAIGGPASATLDTAQPPRHATRS